MLLGVALAACGPGNASGGSINLAAAAGLSDTLAIEIVELPAPDQPAGAPARVVAVVDEPEQIQRLVAVLDQPLDLVPRALCLERYRLRFLLADGETVSYGYSCNGGEAFLRGEQPYWQGMDVEPPERFRQLIGAYLPDPGG